MPDRSELHIVTERWKWDGDGPRIIVEEWREGGFHLIVDRKFDAAIARSKSKKAAERIASALNVPTLRQLTEGWPVGDTHIFVLDAPDLPTSLDGLHARRRYHVVFDDIEYVDDEGKVITTLNAEREATS